MSQPTSELADDLATYRRDRVLTAMADAEIDALILGRQDNAQYATGMARLWTAGTRPFGAGCVVIRATGRTHVLSSWESGLPATMTWDDLYPMTWNPATMASNLADIPGLAEAQRIGVDEISPSFKRGAARFAPGAEIVTADEVMTSVRRIKSVDELDMIAAACAVAWLGVDAALAVAVASDIEASNIDANNNSACIGAAIEAMAAVGHTIPASAPEVRMEGSSRVIDIGIMVDYYEGGVGGRFVDGDRGPVLALTRACSAGATHADLSRAATHEAWLVRGLGMGFEQPVIDANHGQAETLEAGMVLSVGDGDRRDIVAVTNGESRVLSERP